MRGLRTALGRSKGRAEEPRLSVVVPVYNMEECLAGCLDSLRTQTFLDFEAVVVIDGATDRSREIAEEYAAADRRIRVVTQANTGLGAARNTGVREAGGTYLAFLDADDELPPHAYAVMVETLERTGSDLVTGTLKRDTGGRRQAMRLMKENHRVRRERVTLPEMPLMLADVFATNKLFRRSFWDAADLDFPEHFHYEDQPTLTRALLAAKHFDVIPDTVYFWRVRGDQTSITQRRHELADLLDRIESKRVSTALVREAGVPELLDCWFKDVLPVDMWEYFRSVPGAPAEYWSVLRAAVQEFWNDDTVHFDHTRAPAQQRYMGWLVDRGRREDLEQLVAFIDEHRGDIPVQLREDHVVAELPGVGDPDAGPPASVYVLGDHERQWECWITAAGWEGGVLQLGGFALIRNVPTESTPTELSGELVRTDGGVAEWPLDPRAEREPRATRFVGRAKQDFDACGFRADVDLASLVEKHPGPSSWRFRLNRRVEQFEAGGGVTEFDGEQVDRTWHDLSEVAGRPARARLLARGGELFLEIQQREDRDGP